MRPKYVPDKSLREDITKYDKFTVENVDDLSETELNQKYVVKMNFLEDENIMDRAGDIMDFIRNNKKYIVAVEGTMPSVAHIPNRIEGHFMVPYIFNKEDKK